MFPKACPRNKIAENGDFRKRQKIVAGNGNIVAVSGNYVAVFGDYSFGNNLLPFSATLLLVRTRLNVSKSSI